MFLIPEVLHGMSRTMFWIGVHSLIEILRCTGFIFYCFKFFKISISIFHGISQMFDIFVTDFHVIALIFPCSNAESERKIKRLLEGCHLRFGSSIGALVGGGVYFGYGAQPMFYGAGDLFGIC